MTIDDDTDGIRPEALARDLGISGKLLRAWLRRTFPRNPADRNLPWHLSHDQEAARRHFGGTRAGLPSATPTGHSAGSPRRDLAYVTTLVAELLGAQPVREHRFPWLAGDTGSPLPMDAYFPKHALVVECRERQHLSDRPDSFGLWDRRMTASGIPRREQRAKYDRLRESVIPPHGLTLVIVNADDLQVDGRGRLLRSRDADLGTLGALLGRSGVV